MIDRPYQTQICRYYFHFWKYSPISRYFKHLFDILPSVYNIKINVKYSNNKFKYKYECKTQGRKIEHTNNIIFRRTFIGSKTYKILYLITLNYNKILRSFIPSKFCKAKSIGRIASNSSIIIIIKV